MKLQLKCILSSMALTLGMIPMASMASNSYQPATFDFEPSDLVSLMEDNLKQVPLKDSLVVYCQSDVDTDGEALNISCYDNSDSNLATPTAQAVSKLAFSPAKVDGESVPVRFRFRVAYYESGERVEAWLISNIGSMHSAYGSDYIAPQERLDGNSWYQRYAKHSSINGKNFFSEGDQSRVVATVGKDGKTQTLQVLDTKREFKRDAKVLKNAVRKSRYIPGFVKGKPVPMQYMAVVNYNDSVEVFSVR